MTAFELICIVSGQVDRPPNAGTQCLSAAGFTAVFSKKKRPLMTLPVSRAEALKDASERQEIFESLLSFGTVLPAKRRQWIGLEQMSDCLLCNAQLLEKLATRLGDQVQFQITVDWDPAQVLGHFQTAPEMTELFETAHPTAQLLETSLSRLRARLARDILDLITPASTEIIALPRLENTLSNLAALIHRDHEGRLDEAVQAVDGLWSEGLKIRQIGPSAPGSFALVELDWISEAEITAAHKTLGTRATASQTERRTARRSALMAPDSDAARIKHAGAILESAAKGGINGFHRIRILSEDQGERGTPEAKVA